MSTVSQLIDRCSNLLHSYTGVTEQATYLTDAITSSATSIPVKHPTRVTRGIIEVGDELMRVDEITATTVELLPDGRGEAGSTAVTHTANKRVTIDPLIPRARLFEFVKDTLRQVQLTLFQIKATTFVNSPVVNTYELPADTDRVLRVQYEAIGPTKEWVRVTNWRFDEKAAELTNGKSLVINQAMEPGRDVQVVYAASLPVPTTTSVDLDATGISPEIQEIVLHGVCWRALQFTASARLNLNAVEQQERARGVDASSILKVSEQHLMIFRSRLAEERARLLTLFPPTMHYAR